MHAQYLSPFFSEKRVNTIELFRDFFRDWDKDICLVGTGMSGALALATISTLYPHLNFGILRKNTNCHSPFCFERTCESIVEWAFADDLIATGETYRRVSGYILQDFPYAKLKATIIYSGSFDGSYGPKRYSYCYETNKIILRYESTI